MATYYERQRVLEEEFKAIDISQDQRLTAEDYYSALDRKLGRKFDRQIAEQLWSRASDSHGVNVPLAKLIEIMIQAEDSLKSKIELCRRQLEENYKQKRESEMKLQELQLTEKLNIYGIMEGSQCQISIIEGNNLRYADMSRVLDPFVVIRVDKTELQTQTAKGGNPQWQNKEQFSIQIVTGREDLQISICDFDKFTNNVVIGRVNINLQNNNLGIRDQIKHDLWLDLYDQTGGMTGGRLHISIQWIFSRVRYLSDYLNSFKIRVVEQEEELSDYEQDLDCLYEPFLKWQFLYRGQPANQTNHIPMALPIVQQHYGVNPSNRNKPFYDSQLEPIDLFQALKITISIFLLLVVLECFERAAFLDIVIVADFIILYQWNALDENKLKTLGILCIFSIFLDIPWLIIFFREWTIPPAGHTSQDEYLESSSRRFVALTAILCFFIKVGMAGVFFILSNKLTRSHGGLRQIAPKHEILKMDLQGSQVNNLGSSKLFITKGKPVEIY